MGTGTAKPGTIECCTRNSLDDLYTKSIVLTSARDEQVRKRSEIFDQALQPQARDTGNAQTLITEMVSIVCSGVEASARWH